MFTKHTNYQTWRLVVIAAIALLLLALSAGLFGDGEVLRVVNFMFAGLWTGTLFYQFANKPAKTAVKEKPRYY